MRPRNTRIAVFITAVAIIASCGGQAITECTPDETTCVGSCAALYKDPTNCGACGNVCSPGMVCFDGACATSCGGGTVQCGQSCVDTNVDRDNCGHCGGSCPKGLACVAAACTSTCADAQTLCLLQGGSAYCVNTSSDNANCGACGTKCSALEACVGGTCTTACASNQKFCTGDAGAFCASTDTDNENCGACAKACSQGATCTAGICNELCQNGWVCNGTCANFASDVGNCGGCGQDCGAHAYCSSGSCGCMAPYTRCDSACVNVASDPNNCGACGTTCAGTCALGRCLTVISPSNSGDAVAVDATDVYWSGSRIWKAPKGGGTAIDLTGTNVLPAQGMTLDANNVYWNTEQGEDVRSVSKLGGSVVELVSTWQDVIPGFDIDDTTLYYTDHGNGFDVVKSIPLGGGTATTLASGFLIIRGVALRSNVLYWSDAYGVYHSKTDGTGVETISTYVPQSNVTVDDTNVYFTDSSGELLALRVDGSSPPVVLATGIEPYVSPVSDGTNVYAFTGNGELVKVPIEGGAVVELAVSGWSSAVAIDAQSVYWVRNTGALVRLTPK